MTVTGKMVGVTVLTMASCAMAADWPGFAGPRRDGISEETGLLKTWPAEGPKVLWTTTVGEGFGGAAIADGQVFILDRTSETNPVRDVLRCIDLATGNELWSYGYDAPGKTGFNGSRAVPTVTATHVYSVGPFGQFKCIDRKTHNVVWDTNIIEPGANIPPWAIAQSPVIYKNLVIVATQGKSGLAAYDQLTGKVVWQEPGLPSSAYCSPTLVTIDGVDELIQSTSAGIAAFNPVNGEKLWQFGGWKCMAPIPSVISVGDGRLFATAGYKAGSVMLEITKTGPRELWRIPIGSQIHQPIFIDGALYVNTNSNDNMKDGLVCLDPSDGKVIWRSGDTPKIDRGDFVFADGMIYLLDATGTLNLIQPDKTSLKIVSSVKLLGGKDIWAPMALSNGKLVLRDQGQMKCLDVSANK